MTKLFHVIGVLVTSILIFVLILGIGNIWNLILKEGLDQEGLGVLGLLLCLIVGIIGAFWFFVYWI